MYELEERIKKDGVIREGGVLKVGSFLNHQCDVELFDHMGQEWARIFKGQKIDKILTIESSGIGIACVASRSFGSVPVVFAKKTESINLDGESYTAKVHSFTHNRDSMVIVNKSLLIPGEHVLIIDDFLANGCALRGLIEICDSAGVIIEGIGIAIEKGFQPGGKDLRAQGYKVASLSVIDEMDSDTGKLVLGNCPY